MSNFKTSDNYWLKEHKKPLFRWTVGPCIKQGFDILRESVSQALRVYGDRFKFVICHNNLNDDQKEVLKSIASLNVELYEQSWEHCSLPIDNQCLKKVDGNFPITTVNCNGSVWKYCPDRLRPHSHELIVDNDLIIVSPIKQIEDFLNSTNKSLLLQDRFRYYGRYDKMVSHSKFLNTGMIGLPPDYNLKNTMLEFWNRKKHNDITQADEQGLVASALAYDFGPSLIVVNEILEVLARDPSLNFCTSYSGNSRGDEIGYINKNVDECNGFHFCQANKIDNHIGWSWYMNKKRLFC